MDSNLGDFLSALNEHRVRYVLVWGYAVGVHSQPRVTKDLDIFIDLSPENACAVHAALAAFGAPLSGIEVEDFQKPYSIVRIGNPPICFDILQHIDGVDFETAWRNSVEDLVNGDVPTRYISADYLIVNKLASGRPQDLADVDAIQQSRAANARIKHNIS